MRNHAIAVALFVALPACSREAPAPAPAMVNRVDSITSLYAQYGCLGSLDHPDVLTIEALLASPRRFEGKPVRIEGFYYAGQEHSALYPDIANGETFNTHAGLWVLEGLPPQSIGKRVTVEGIFTSRTRGHLGQWPGTICNARVVASSSGHYKP